MQQDLTPSERFCFSDAHFIFKTNVNEVKKLLEEDDLRKDGAGAVRNRRMRRNHSRYKSGGESEEEIKTRCSGGVPCVAACPICKFPHLKTGEIHFSHRWEQARLISLKYPICWWERGDASGKERTGGDESKQG